MLRSLIASFLLCVLSVFIAVEAQAQDYSSLQRSFDVGRLTHDDKRFLQTALAFEGNYSGLLDGDWGKLSRSAMADFSREEFGGRTEEWHMVALALNFFDRYEREGWQIEYMPALGISILVPQKSLIVDPPSKKFVNWRHSGSSLAYSVGVFGRSASERLYEYTLNRHALADEPYIVRKPNLAVSTSTDLDGVFLYTRSDFVNGAWTTVMLSAHRSEKATLTAVAASISPRREPPITFTRGGALDFAIETAIALATEEDDTSPPVKADTDERRTDDTGGAGTGFIVSECQRRSKNRPRGGAKAGHFLARLSPP